MIGSFRSWRAAAFLTVVTFCVVVIAVPTVLAQTLDRGDIAGVIRDQTGAPLGGVTVTLRETRTGVERVVLTRDDGRYSAPLLSTGVYVVQAARSDFSLVTSAPLTLEVGQALVVNLVM